VKTIKARFDNVFALQLKSLCDTLGMTPEQYVHLAVLEQTILVQEKIRAIRKELEEAEAKEVSGTTT
jgi:hypothetical protein